MNRFDQHREFPAACLYAVGLSAYVSRTLLLSLSTVADAKISKRPWVNFQSAGWVSFQSAPTMQGAKSNRQRIWEAIRAECTEFKLNGISRRANTDHSTVRSYLRSLIKGGYIKVVSGKAFEEQTLLLIKDVGAEAPAVTIEGKPSSAGKGTEAMWRTLRILGELDADELAAQASIVVPTTSWTARGYLKWLKLAGYVIEVKASKPGQKARYRLAPGKYTGPRPPMVQRIGQVFDPNLGEVVFRKESKEEVL